MPLRLVAHRRHSDARGGQGAGDAVSDPVALAAPGGQKARPARSGRAERRGGGARPPRERPVLDPVSLGALVVSAAQLAWTIHRDRNRKAPPDVVAHEVRMRLEAPADVTTEQRDRLVEAVVREAVVAAEQGP